MSNIIVDLTNKFFGNLLVLSQNGRDPWGQVRWKCSCSCGKEITVTSGALRRAHGNISCGCIKAIRIGNLNKSHGESKSKPYQKFRGRYKKYGITPEEYKALEEEQDYRCKICGVIPDGSIRGHSDLCVDHSHVTGRIRGLLCHHCNTGIGMLKDSETILQSAIEYLRQMK